MLFQRVKDFSLAGGQLLDMDFKGDEKLVAGLDWHFSNSALWTENGSW